MQNRFILIFILFTTIAFAQNGLENIIVEKYYVSNAKDTLANKFGGKLPVGSVTYRIYVDMLPGYRFQAVYGIPGHELKLATSTLFFNNEDKGGVLANVIPDRNLKDNTVMLDSWLSAGGASESNLGVLKTKDDGVGTIINEKSFLQNDNIESGTPIKMQDGLIKGEPPRVTGFGIDSIIKVFDNKTIGSLFGTSNGSWATLGGSIGPDSLDNKVLIAQITTDGVFSFELNIQIGTPGGSVENYVAKNAVANEIVFPGLIYQSDSFCGARQNKKKSID